MSNFKETILPAVASGLPLIGSVVSALSARNQNRKQIERDERFWHMQNEYNSPQKQMERLQAAGLNPNLVYGSGASGASGSADKLSSPDVDSSAHRWIEPQGAVQTLSGYADWAVKQAQTDNLKASTQANQENALLTATRTYGEGLRNAQTHLDVQRAEELYKTSVEAGKVALEKQKADLQFTLNQDERAAIATANSTMQAVENVLSMRLGRVLTSAQIANIRADNELKELDKRLAQMGIRPADPFYATAIARFLLKYREIRDQQ